MTEHGNEASSQLKPFFEHKVRFWGPRVEAMNMFDDPNQDKIYTKVPGKVIEYRHCEHMDIEHDELLNTHTEIDTDGNVRVAICLSYLSRLELDHPFEYIT